MSTISPRALRLLVGLNFALTMALIVLFVSFWATGKNDLNSNTSSSESGGQGGDSSVKSLISDGHPRSNNEILQYKDLDTALAENVVIADLLDSRTEWFNWKKQPVQPHGVPDETDYANTHNHYQSLASEVINFVPWANAVGVWGDSWAANNRSRAWGALFTARADCDEKWAYNPKSQKVDCTDFDSQLVGVEVDVINLAKPGRPPNEGKTGVQVVGFGEENTMAFEARTATPGEGRFTLGMNFADAITPDGTLIATWQKSMGRGLELSNTRFKNGVISYKSDGRGTGFIANEGRGGQVFSQTDREGADTLVVEAGTGGFAIRHHGKSENAIEIDQSGDIRLNGDVYVEGRLFVNGREVK